MTSYKTLYLELLEKMENEKKERSIEHILDYVCPLCNSHIIEKDNEWYCMNDDCKFDKTSDDLFMNYVDNKSLEYREFHS